jgi:hypothetical protein
VLIDGEVDRFLMDVRKSRLDREFVLLSEIHENGLFRRGIWPVGRSFRWDG